MKPNCYLSFPGNNKEHSIWDFSCQMPITAKKTYSNTSHPIDTLFHESLFAHVTVVILRIKPSSQVFDMMFQLPFS